VNKNGKTIKCKVCENEFYISESRFGKKKYCSVDCARSDNWGFIPEQRKCVICENEFTIKSQLDSNRQTCSYQCHNKLQRKITSERAKKKVNKSCKTCGRAFIGLKFLFGTGVCEACRNKKMSEDRKGEGNPNYTHGLAMNRKYGGNHARACARYKEEFIKKNGRIKCESCGTSRSMRFETHHICPAGRFPKHEYLHDSRNLILLCIQCHNDFHSMKRKEERESIVVKRGLRELFGRRA
jgi:hypothetical protein